MAKSVERLRTRLEGTEGAVSNCVIKQEILERKPEDLFKCQTIRHRCSTCSGEEEKEGGDISLTH